jgi:hypothetical protein
MSESTALRLNPGNTKASESPNAMAGMGGGKEKDSGQGSPRRWGWGIPLKKTIRQPESRHEHSK